MTTDNRTLTAQHADSLIESINARVDAGAPFGHINDMDEWHDIDECEDDCEGNEASALDYLSDVLDIQYLVDSDKSYLHARILISFGGPNVYIDTRTEQLEVHWSGSEYRELPREFISQLDDALAELWEMRA